MESSKISFIIPGVGIESRYLDISCNFTNHENNELFQELLLKIASEDAKGLLPKKLSPSGNLLNKILENCVSINDIYELRRLLKTLSKIGFYGKEFAKLFSQDITDYLNRVIQ